MIMRQENRQEVFLILKALAWCILLITLASAVFYRIAEYYILKMI